MAKVLGLLLSARIVCGAIIAYPPLEGIRIAEDLQLWVSAEPGSERHSVPVGLFVNSTSRGVGPPATTMRVARFGATATATCSLAWSANRDWTNALLRGVGFDGTVRWGSRSIEFDVMAGIFYSILLSNNVSSEWVSVWVDDIEEDDADEHEGCTQVVVDDAAAALARAVASVCRPVMVRFPAGEYNFTQPLVIDTDDVHIRLQAGAVLRYVGGTTKNVTWPAVVRLAGRRTSLSGHGALDANGFVGHSTLVSCFECSVRDVFLFGSAGWGVHVLSARNVAIKAIKIFSGADGLDIDMSQNVRVTDVTVNSWDDAFVIKTTADGMPTRNVRLERIVAWTRKSAFKLGTESYADFANVVFDGFEGYDLDRGCVAVARDGALVRRIAFQSGRLFFKSWQDQDQRYGTAFEVEAEHRHGGDANSSFVDIDFADIYVGGTLLSALKLKSIQLSPLHDVFFSRIYIALSALNSSQQTNASTYLVDCLNTYISNTSVFAANFKVDWNGNQPFWLGLSPSWPRHTPPPPLLPLCAGALPPHPQHAIPRLRPAHPSAIV